MCMRSKKDLEVFLLGDNIGAMVSSRGDCTKAVANQSFPVRSACEIIYEEELQECIEAAANDFMRLASEKDDDTNVKGLTCAQRSMCQGTREKFH